MKNFFRILEPLKSHIPRMQKIGYSELMVRELLLYDCAAFDTLFDLGNLLFVFQVTAYTRYLYSGKECLSEFLI